MFASLLLAVLSSSCAVNQSQLSNSDKIFDAAAKLLDDGNTVSAKQEYDRGMEALAQTQWSEDDKSCDGIRYTYQRLVVTLHSLSVAIRTHSMTGYEARRHSRDMETSLNVVSLRQRYPDLASSEERYVDSIEAAAKSEMLAVHSPSASSCIERFVPAEGVNLVSPEPPFDMPGGHFTVDVLVHLDAAGKIIREEVRRSSGIRVLDEETLAAARQSTYLPEVRDCKVVPGDYLFRVTFEGAK